MKRLVAIFVFISMFGFSQTSTIYPNFDFELGNLNNWTFYGANRSSTAHSITTISSCTVPATPTTAACGTFIVDTITAPIITCSLSSVTPFKPGKYIVRKNSSGMACYQFTVNASAPVLNLQYAQLLVGGGETYTYQPFNQIMIRDVGTNSVIPGTLSDFCAATHSSVAVPIGGDAYCLGWGLYTMNLSAYVGQVLKMEFYTLGCAFSGHSSHVYFDGFFSTTTGVKEADLPKSIQIVPNPANDFITIKKPFDEELWVLIYDSQGRVVKEEFSEKIDVSDLQKGFYFVRALGKQNNYSQTFIKE